MNFLALILAIFGGAHRVDNCIKAISSAIAALEKAHQYHTKLAMKKQIIADKVQEAIVAADNEAYRASKLKEKLAALVSVD